MRLYLSSDMITFLFEMGYGLGVRWLGNELRFCKGNSLLYWTMNKCKEGLHKAIRFLSAVAKFASFKAMFLKRSGDGGLAEGQKNKNVH